MSEELSPEEKTPKEKWPPLDPGTEVMTTQLDEDRAGDYTTEGLAKKKWGVKGVITTHHDAHGLCYEVLHDDNTEATYEPTEIVVVSR